MHRPKKYFSVRIGGGMRLISERRGGAASAQAVRRDVIGRIAQASRTQRERELHRATVAAWTAPVEPPRRLCRGGPVYNQATGQAMSDESVYRQLQLDLDRMPVGFPATDSGVEIRVLRQLFTPLEARAALCLGMLLEPLSPASTSGLRASSAASR